MSGRPGRGPLDAVITGALLFMAGDAGEGGQLPSAGPTSRVAVRKVVRRPPYNEDSVTPHLHSRRCPVATWCFLLLLLALAACGGGDASPEAAEASSCIGCHREATPGVVTDWELSRHSAAGVECSLCHGDGHRTADDCRPRSDGDGGGVQPADRLLGGEDGRAPSDGSSRAVPGPPSDRPGRRQGPGHVRRRDGRLAPTPRGRAHREQHARSDRARIAARRVS